MVRGAPLQEMPITRVRLYRCTLFAIGSGRGEDVRPREKPLGGDCLFSKGESFQPLAHSVPGCVYGSASSNEEVWFVPEESEGPLQVGRHSDVRHRLWCASTRILPLGGYLDGGLNVWRDV